MKVALLPMGPVPRDLVAWLSAALAGYGIACELRPEAPLPPEAFDADRRQYRAESLLEVDDGNRADRTLAVTAEDLYAEGLNFVFGLADAGGTKALVSFHRLETADVRRFRERVLKECVHELGHTLGLGHCPDAECVMCFSDSPAEADAKRLDFCATCRAKLPVPLGSPR